MPIESPTLLPLRDGGVGIPHQPVLRHRENLRVFRPYLGVRGSLPRVISGLGFRDGELVGCG